MNWIDGQSLYNQYHDLHITQHINRYRQLSTFGRTTIRRFTRNVSEMNRIGARDFEDMLQVSKFIII
jgi:hypothetical protein